MYQFLTTFAVLFVAIMSYDTVAALLLRLAPPSLAQNKFVFVSTKAVVLVGMIGIGYGMLGYPVSLVRLAIAVVAYVGSVYLIDAIWPTRSA